MKVKIKRIRPGVLFPTQGTPGSAGWDIYVPKGAFEDQYATYNALYVHGSYDLSYADIGPGNILSFKCGFALEIPEGYYVSVVPRSSMGKKGLYIPNAPATIDRDFRGELTIMIQNLGVETQRIREGDRVAQMILHKYHDFEFEEVSELDETNRGAGGFGSTGK